MSTVAEKVAHRRRPLQIETRRSTPLFAQLRRVSVAVFREANRARVFRYAAIPLPRRHRMVGHDSINAAGSKEFPCLCVVILRRRNVKNNDDVSLMALFHSFCRNPSLKLNELYLRSDRLVDLVHVATSGEDASARFLGADPFDSFRISHLNNCA